ncbi:hypothetical protein IQ07DRAFT_29630 [Pyrenochaeta sp. DS3sAY3a]|nr:hypothetical protein IQ07DRAFT_29630 [Pyrenochaeta sp. DS3sAY3a]
MFKGHKSVHPLNPLNALPNMDQSREARGWYTNHSRTSNDQLLHDAFAEGKDAFTTLCDDEKDKTWISSQVSAYHVLEAVQAARDKYNNRRTTKAWKWLTQFSARVNHYGPILDVMVQHHPEYAALVWGAMKILFVGVQNHEESVHQLSKALCRFAECLPRHELKLILYPSPQMQEAISKLYAHLIQFLVRAMRWYQKGKVRRAVGAVFKPFALDFQEQLNEVNELSRSVDDIATTAAQAELRAVHEKFDETNKELSFALMEIKRLRDHVSHEADRVFQVASCNHSLSSQIQLDLQSHTTMIRTIQLNQIISAPFMNDITSSGTSLTYCSAFARRQGHAITLASSEVEGLRNWSKNYDISYLIMESRDAVYGKNLLLNLLQQIQTAKRPIIWALRFADYRKQSPSIEYILRTLVLHALEINSNALALQDFPISLASLRGASSQDDWLSILNRCLAGLEMVYIVIDPDLLRFAAEENSCTAADLLLALGQDITSTRIKIIVSSLGINKGYFTRLSAAGSWKAMKTAGEQRQRLAIAKRQHLARVRRMKRP